jgi:hypothetical protein
MVDLLLPHTQTNVTTTVSLSVVVSDPMKTLKVTLLKCVFVGNIETSQSLGKVFFLALNQHLLTVHHQ